MVKTNASKPITAKPSPNHATKNGPLALIEAGSGKKPNSFHSNDIVLPFLL